MEFYRVLHIFSVAKTVYNVLDIILPKPEALVVATLYLVLCVMWQYFDMKWVERR
jgi:hypothetical protein